MAQMGRPRIEINKEEFEKLCALLCSEEEIASWFDVSVDTLCRWCKREYGVTFAEIYKTKSEKGRIALRRYQFKLAEKYPAMAIFLGKQYLGQRDNVDNAEGVDEGVPPVINIMDCSKDGEDDE
ncbi:MAG TPA: hypothetical protein DE061_01605 [Clostridiales bacterium]|nr:hypothetical protein [Clostridiales bacterium]